MIRAVRFENAKWSRVENVADISDILAEGNGLVWAILDQRTTSPTDIATIGEELSLHALAVEDATRPRQRPKLEQYEGHLFAVMHALRANGGDFEPLQISSFIGPRWVLTIHDGADFESWIARLLPPIEGQGTSAIMHALLDAVVDGYEELVETLEDEVAKLEADALGDGRRPKLASEVFGAKRQLVTLRHYLVPGERVLASLTSATTSVPSEIGLRFRDVHDHLLRSLDSARTVEHVLDAIVNLQRAEQQAEFGEITKRLTGWGAIIAVPTFIASVYGMNFRLVPAENSLAGFWIALCMMGASSVALFALFRRKRWI